MRVSINMGKNAQAMQSTTTAQSDIGYKEKKQVRIYNLYFQAAKCLFGSTKVVGNAQAHSIKVVRPMLLTQLQCTHIGDSIVVPYVRVQCAMYYTVQIAKLN